jgi:hypothetical protein
MPHYSFDLQDDEFVSPDTEGLDYPDDEVAKREALRGLAELARDHLPSHGPPQTLVMTVRSGARIVLELVLTLTAKPTR